MVLLCGGGRSSPSAPKSEPTPPPTPLRSGLKPPGNPKPSPPPAGGSWGSPSSPLGLESPKWAASTMISVLRRLFPSLSVQLRFCIRPSTMIIRPFAKYRLTNSAVLRHATQSKKSVSFSPLVFLKSRSHAIENLQNCVPACVVFNSGSWVKRPIMIALFSIFIPSK